MTRYRAIIAYDGTDFSGFQRQTNARSVQGEIESAIERVIGEPVETIGAGRTDAGVHATGQVIAFDAPNWRHNSVDLHRAINSVLPMDIAVSELESCDKHFHPRFDAVSRVYEYVVLVTQQRQPLWRRVTWQVSYALDLALMNEAATELIGEHNFATFGSPTIGESTVRTVLRADWQMSDLQRFVFTIEANGFLFRMVRRLTMALVQIGSGRINRQVFVNAFKSCDSNQITGAAPASGLCLVKVKY